METTYLLRKLGLYAAITGTLIIASQEIYAYGTYNIASPSYSGMYPNYNSNNVPYLSPMLGHWSSNMNYRPVITSMYPMYGDPNYTPALSYSMYGMLSMQGMGNSFSVLPAYAANTTGAVQSAPILEYKPYMYSMYGPSSMASGTYYTISGMYPMYHEPAYSPFLYSMYGTPRL